MPSKNSLKLYSENGYYHIYNRGVAKSEIYLSDQDYHVFINYLREYLSPPVAPTPEEIRKMDYKYIRKNYYDEIELLSFCLMPNHFHLLLKQKQAHSIEKFMRSLLTRYSVYFNKHYDRVGHLFQGVYKGILIGNDEYLWWLSRYIHRNPLEIKKYPQQLTNYQYSSYPTYLNKEVYPWIRPQIILANIKDYRNFVEGNDQKYPEGIDDLLFE